MLVDKIYRSILLRLFLERQPAHTALSFPTLHSAWDSPAATSDDERGPTWQLLSTDFKDLMEETCYTGARLPLSAPPHESNELLWGLTAHNGCKDSSLTVRMVEQVFDGFIKQLELPTWATSGFLVTWEKWNDCLVWQWLPASCHTQANTILIPVAFKVIVQLTISTSSSNYL